MLTFAGLLDLRGMQQAYHSAREPQTMADDQRQNNGDPQSGPPSNQPPQGKLGRGPMSWVLILGVLLLFFTLLNNSPPAREIKGWQNFKVLINPDGGKLAEASPGNPMPVVIKSDRIVATIRPHDPALNSSSEPAWSS